MWRLVLLPVMSLQSIQSTEDVRELEALVYSRALYVFARAARFGCIEYDDLVQEGWVGMLQAQQRFIAGVGNAPTLGGFAHKRVFGAMVDYVRKTVPGGRRLAGTILVESLETPILENLTLGDTLASHANPEQDAIAEERAATVQRAVGQLSARERYIITRYYVEGASQREIAEELRVGQSRVCQILARALLKLQGMLPRGLA